jgi:hypothetical protein
MIQETLDILVAVFDDVPLNLFSVQSRSLCEGIEVPKALWDHGSEIVERDGDT